MALGYSYSGSSTEINPVYTPFFYVLNSSLVSEPDFKYCFDLKLFNQSSLPTIQKQLGVYKLYPKSDSSCVYSPANILQNHVSYNFVFFGSGWTSNRNSTAMYEVTPGEEYTVTGYTFTSVTNSGGFCQYDFVNSIPVEWKVGDTIKIEKYLKNINLDYDGLQAITLISSNNIETDKVYGVATSSESGECISRLSYSKDLKLTGVCFNAARQYRDVNKSFANTHYAFDGNRKFLTNLEGEIKIGIDDVFSLSYLQDKSVSAVTEALVYVYSGLPISNATAYGLYRITNTESASPFPHQSFKCGTKNFAETYEQNLVTLNTEQVFQSGLTKAYVVTLLNGNSQVMESRTFIVDNRCTFNYARLAWLNDLGGWSFMNFHMKQREEYSIERTLASKVLPWNYSLGDFTELVTSSSIEQTIILNSFDFLNDAEYNHFLTLFTSPFVLYIGSDNYTYPFIITSKDYKPKKQINDRKERSLQIKGRFAFPYNLQSN
jgi:hypothetical protein